MVNQSNIVIGNNLISYENWESYVDTLKSQVKRDITDEKQAIDNIKDVFIDSIKKRFSNDKFGVLFSGGVDSVAIAYVCSLLKQDFVCYTVGLEGSQDIVESVKVAKALNLNHVKKTLTVEELEQVFKELVKIFPKHALNIVNLGVGAVELAAIKLAQKDKINIFFTGLGSEEIFAGYKRHEDSKNINEECWFGLKSMWERDFQRDYSIATSTNSTFLTPFLDKELIINSMEIDSSLKICKGCKKYIFRKVVEDLELPTEFAFRPKKAAQYGSNFDKAIIKLAKSKGFKYKKEYLNYLCNNK